MWALEGLLTWRENSLIPTGVHNTFFDRMLVGRNPNKNLTLQLGIGKHGVDGNATSLELAGASGFAGS